MLYCVIYDIKDAKDSAKEEAFLKQLKEFGETNQFISNCWFLDSSKDKDEIYEELKSKLDAPDLLFIAETRLTQMSGWLPNTSIEWLKVHPE